VKRKALVSPGFGAGWSTWASSHAKELATDAELIRLVEAGEHLRPDAKRHGDDIPVTDAFRARVLEITGGEDPYYGGVFGLEVQEVSGQFRVDEYDGYESITEASDQEWF
jgi:hypothetical protein